jgi:hypothetical protein
MDPLLEDGVSKGYPESEGLTASPVLATFIVSKHSFDAVNDAKLLKKLIFVAILTPSREINGMHLPMLFKGCIKILVSLNSDPSRRLELFVSRQQEAVPQRDSTLYPGTLNLLTSRRRCLRPNKRKSQLPLQKSPSATDGPKCLL